jgi:hypothetical protein
MNTNFVMGTVLIGLNDNESMKTNIVLLARR